MKQSCARWGCIKEATYDKPLCYEHWLEYEAWELDECSRCNYFYSSDDFISYTVAGNEVLEEYPLMCDTCNDMTLIEDGKERIFGFGESERRIIKAHATVERPIRYLYILKLSDGTFYVGQTNDLGMRLQEHKDGLQQQTKGKDPKMVYHESFEGMRKEVNEREIEYTILNSTGAGQRKLRQMIEKFRAPLRLLDLEA